MLRVVFMGTPDFSVPSLQALAGHHDVVAVFTRRDRPRGRGRKVTPSPVKAWALEHGVTVEQPRTLRDEAGPELVAAHEPDLVVVVAYGLILPPGVLDLPRHGSINVHASLLPRHRGASPVAWAIASGDTLTGVTTMLMDEGLDTGPILLQREEPIGPRDTTPELTRRLAGLGADLLVDTVDGWTRGEIEARPQDDDRATTAPMLSRADGALDWDTDPEVVDRRVRALQPWPGTFTFAGDERLRIWSVEPLTAAVGTIPPVDDAAPGTVLRDPDGGLHVACRTGAVRVLELQRPGGRPLPAADFLRGHDLEPGLRLAAAPADDR